MANPSTSPLTVGTVIANAARGAPEATAAVIDNQPITFAQLDAAGTAVARHLVANGYGAGSRALVAAPTSAALLATFVGCARAGVVFVPFNAALGLDEYLTTARRLDTTVALTPDTEWAHQADGILPFDWFPSTLPEPAREGLLPNISGTDPHVAFLTSGTTGKPKAAVISHQTSVLRSHPGSQLEPRGPALCPYPLFHMGGWTIAMQQWHARASVVFVDGTDAPTLSAALRDHNIERFNAIPALWSRLAEHMISENTASEDTASGAFPHLRFADTGTSPTSVALLESIVDMAPNAHVRVFYGSTEAGNVTSLHHNDLLRVPGSCGQPSVLTSLRLGDDDELQISGPLLFDGYLNDPEATAAALRDGWFHTGDRASIDTDGYVHILGRLGTVIRSGGESIVPETVEGAASTHSAISDVAVFGVPDEKWGETVWAAVVCDPPLSVDELRKHLRAADLPAFAHPRELLHVDAIPRTSATGQIDRQQLRAQAMETR